MKPKAYSYIRYSSSSQEKGDSERRQSDPDAKIAEKLKLPLDDTLHLTDKGLSGYYGDNRDRGALGEFIKSFDEGKIAVGSILIMENLDRLTRLPVLQAEYLYAGILIRGIGIYTWMDEKLHTMETYNIGTSILKSINLDQGNQESEKKRIRAREFWNNKREDARNGKRKLTRECPIWLEPIPDPNIKSKFVTIDFKPVRERVAVIKLIFKMKLAGKGSDKIAKELNQTKGIWKPKKGAKEAAWTPSTIEFILNNNRTLLGEFQPHRFTKVNGKRINIIEGDPIPNYYGKPVIDLVLFNRVQKLIRDNAKKDGRGGGRGDLVNNLFGQLAYCNVCGAPMRYKSGGGTPYTSQYRCANSILGLCDKIRLHYYEVEQAVLTYCKGLDVADIIPDKEKTLSELSILENQLQAKNGEITLLKEEMESILSTKLSGKSEVYKKALEHRYASFDLNLDKLTKERDNIQEQINQLPTNDKQTEEQINSIKELLDLMKELEGQEKINFRLNLRTHLRQLIKQIEIDVNKKIIRIYFPSGQWRIIRLNPSDPSRKVIDRLNPPKSIIK